MYPRQRKFILDVWQDRPTQPLPTGYIEFGEEIGDQGVALAHQHVDFWNGDN
jgi:hypothetical protein